MTEDRPVLYLQEHGSTLTIRTEPEGAALNVALQCGQVAVAMPLRRDQVRALIETLDDFLYDSRPA